MILDALKRSREPVPGGGSVPTLDTEHYAAITTTAAPSWVWLLAGVTVASLGFSGFVWLSSDSASTPTLASANTTAVAPLPNLSVTSAQPSLSPKPGPPGAIQGAIPEAVPEASLPVASKLKPATLEPVSLEPEPRETSGISAIADETSRSVPSASVATLYASRSVKGGGGTVSSMDDQPPATQESAASEKPVVASADTQQRKADDTAVNTDEVLRRAQAAIGEERLTEYPAPLLESLSQQQKDRIPTLMYRQHDWSSTGESRVLLNGQRLKAGDQHDGFKVQAILRDSVILEWGGTTFRLRALNSWINL